MKWIAAWFIFNAIFSILLWLKPLRARLPRVANTGIMLMSFAGSSSSRAPTFPVGDMVSTPSPALGSRADYDATLDIVRAAMAGAERCARPVPPAISPFLQAFTAGLHREAAGYAAGREDGGKGASFRPLHFDEFSYASGYVDGRRFGRKNNGG